MTNLYQQGFPVPAAPLVDDNGVVKQPWQNFFLALWNRTGGSVNGVPILTNLGTTNGQFLLYNGTGWVATNTGIVIKGGSIDGTPVGATTPSTGAFTSLNASGQVQFGSLNAAGVVHNNALGILSSSLINTADINPGAVTYAKIQAESASTLLGNPTGSAVSPSEITLGSTLGFSGSILQTNAFTGDVTTPTSNSFVTTVAQIQGTTVSGTTGSGKVVFQTSPTINTPTIAGGTLDNAPVGSSTPSTGAFTTLAASTSLKLNGSPVFDKINIQVFTSSGTYTPTTGTVFAIVEAVGSGAGGGAVVVAVAGQSSASAGGGSGAYARSFLTIATIGVSQTVTIGAAGTGGTAGGAGGNGSACSFGTLVVAGGGQGGSGCGVSSATGLSVSGGAGGTATAGNVQVTGNAGGSAFCYGTLAFGGFGGGSVFGGSPQGPNGFATGSGTGGAGQAYGAGGAGAFCSGAGAAQNGAAGAKGVVIVTEFISS